MLNNIGIYHYLILGFILFLTGLCGVVLSRNIIKILISIEFMLTAVNINFTTFGLHCKNLAFDGYIFALFYIAAGAVELAIALYIFYAMYREKQTSNIEDYGDV